MYNTVPLYFSRKPCHLKALTDLATKSNAIFGPSADKISKEFRPKEMTKDIEVTIVTNTLDKWKK